MGSPYGENNPKRVDLDKVEGYTLADFGLTPKAVKAYMYGVTVQDPETGKEMGDEFFNHILETKVAYAEDKLDIAILPRVIGREHHDYYENEYNSYAYVSLYKRPVLQVETFKLVMNNFKIFDYPSEWWKIYPSAGQIQVFPSPLLQATGIMTNNQSLGVLGMPVSWMATNNLVQSNYAPQTFDIDYVAGFLPPSRAGVTRDFEFPMELQQLIIKYALKEVFQVWGRLLIGAGIASYGRSIDGLSENVVTTQSAMYTGSRADIDIIDADIANLEGALAQKFQPAFNTI